MSARFPPTPEWGEALPAQLAHITLLVRREAGCALVAASPSEHGRAQSRRVAPVVGRAGCERDCASAGDSTAGSVATRIGSLRAEVGLPLRHDPVDHRAAREDAPRPRARDLDVAPEELAVALHHAAVRDEIVRGQRRQDLRLDRRRRRLVAARAPSRPTRPSRRWCRAARAARPRGRRRSRRRWRRARACTRRERAARHVLDADAAASPMNGDLRRCAAPSAPARRRRRRRRTRGSSARRRAEAPAHRGESRARSACRPASRPRRRRSRAPCRARSRRALRRPPSSPIAAAR